MAKAPPNRDALFREIAEMIGWGITPYNVEAIAEKIEALGVRMIPSALIPAGTSNPYAPPSKQT